MEAFNLAFGDDDVYTSAVVPDNVITTAVSLTLNVSRVVK